MMASFYIGVDSAIYIPSFCAHLAEFSLSNYSVTKAFILTFARAGTLPAFQTLAFIECGGLERKISLLLQCRFPSLSVLNYFRTEIDAPDLQALTRVLNNENSVFPQLTSLILIINYDFYSTIFFIQNPCRLQELFLKSAFDISLQGNISWSGMQSLKRLGLFNISKITALKSLKQLPSLKSLTLSSCAFNQNHLKTLAESQLAINSHSLILVIIMESVVNCQCCWVTLILHWTRCY